MSLNSAAFQAPFSFNGVVIETTVQATAGQTITVELRTSVDGQTWTDWQTATPATVAGGRSVSQLIVARPFTSWLEYRALLSGGESPALDEVALTYINSTAGPALVDLVSREPLAGPTTQTPPPLAIGRTDWSGQPAPPTLERQTPQRIVISQIRTPVDDPNSAATLRAVQWATVNSYGQADLGLHYVVNGSGTALTVQPSATVQLPSVEPGTVRVAVLADAATEGVSEAAQAGLTALLAWLAEAYSIAPSAITAAPDAPAQLAALIPELRANLDRAAIRWRRFFPEGSPGNGVERLILLNPGAAEAHATLVGYTAAGAQRRSVTVPAGQRVDVTVSNAFAESTTLGLAVLADRPLVAERTQISGRELLGSTGAAAPHRTWYFAAGATDNGAQTYLLLINPQPTATAAQLTLYPDGTAPVTKTLQLAAQSRTTVLLNDLIPDQRFGLKLVALAPIVAERSLFTLTGAAGLATGSDQLSRRWLFAEGSTTAGYTTTLHLLNPWPDPVSVAVQVLSEDGTTVSRRYAVPGTARLSVLLSEVAPDLPFALDVRADRPLVAERELLFSDGQGLTIGPGTTAPATQWTFAEGSTAAPAEQFILIANPNRAPVSVDADYTLADGTLQHHTYLMPPTSRLSLATSADAPDQPVLTTRITASRPVVAERSIYVRGVDGIGGETSLGQPGR